MWRRTRPTAPPPSMAAPRGILAMLSARSFANGSRKASPGPRRSPDCTKPNTGVWVASRCRRAFCWNSMWRNLQRHEVIESSGEVNWLIDGPCGERLPAIDLAHVELTGGDQRPEQHGGSLC